MKIKIIVLTLNSTLAVDFFFRPYIFNHFSNQPDNSSDCKLYTSCRVAHTRYCKFSTRHRFATTSCRFYFRASYWVSKPICKTHKSALQSKFCKKACQPFPRSGNFPNCLKVAFGFCQTYLTLISIRFYRYFFKQ